MSSLQVRPFRRSDRDQLTSLVNAHASAVVPGMAASVSTVLTSLERRPGEFIEDTWVRDRATLVAEQQGRVVAAAHLLRYFDDERAGNAARNSAEICWLLFWPEAPAGNAWWTDATAAAGALMTASLALLDRWEVATQHADGDLPVPGVYGVPEQWPHIRDLYARAGFEHTGHTEIVYLARVQDLPPAAKAPVEGMRVARSVGINGCRLSGMVADRVVGYIEVETLDVGERLGRHGGWADVGNLLVDPGFRRRGVGTWLLGQAAGWLRLANVDRLLDYAWQDGADPAGASYEEYRAFLPAAGFSELTRTERGWTRAVPGLVRPEPAPRRRPNGAG
ncbi:MAG TPA: GNAT family N-acetyltransferase [Streptosporangiaceae bacterium]